MKQVPDYENLYVIGESAGVHISSFAHKTRPDCLMLRFDDTEGALRIVLNPAQAKEIIWMLAGAIRNHDEMHGREGSR